MPDRVSCQAFNFHLRENFDHVPTEAEDIEAENTIFCASIVVAVR